MTDNPFHQDDMKRKIRKLKKIEMKIRFGHQQFAGNKQMLIKKTMRTDLVWDSFFGKQKQADAQDKANKGNGISSQSHYSVETLAAMDKEAFQEVVAAFFAHVYYQFYRENGLMNLYSFDPKLLYQLGLSFDADHQAVKKQFRKLALQHHPDTGGDVEKFIELMDLYENLNKHQI